MAVNLFGWFLAGISWRRRNTIDGHSKVQKWVDGMICVLGCLVNPDGVALILRCILSKGHFGID